MATEEETLAYEMKQIATDECSVQQDLYKKWISTLEHKNGIDVLKILSERLCELVKDLADQQAHFRSMCEKMELGEVNSSEDEDKMLRDLTGSYVWIFKVSEGICSHAGEQLYHLIEDDELKRRIIEFHNKPKIEN